MPTNVVNGVAEIAEAVRRGPVIVRKRDDETPPPIETMFEIQDAELAMRESKWHEFSVPDHYLCTRLKIVCVFKGVFTARGYILGRLAAALYRIPADGSPPLSIGFAPTEEVQLNTPDSFGRICIIHAPSAAFLPVQPGKYRVVIAAASKTSYSISVAATCGYSVKDCIETRLSECLEMQKRRPIASRSCTIFR